eukprot:GILK01023078.1.p1 GENE.GILK01023078.1~~GILK01023078.1.p1  ORF type:complete len:149 (-),score=17.37 GILK01023078.1:103-549(-)
MACSSTVVVSLNVDDALKVFAGLLFVDEASLAVAALSDSNSDLFNAITEACSCFEVTSFGGIFVGVEGEAPPLILLVTFFWYGTAMTFAFFNAVSSVNTQPRPLSAPSVSAAKRSRRASSCLAWSTSSICLWTVALTKERSSRRSEVE